MQTKYIFITGGVVSGLGKGIAAASIGALLETRGLSISLMKLDPYINVDAGTMNPFQHGEVFVTEDGAETDLDLGHYERFSSAVLGRKHNTTTGQIYDAIIRKEREGEYLGATVQVVPHVIDEIKAQIEEASKGVDISIVEIGGTVGDIESLPFLEAIRQYRHDHGRENSLFVHLTLIVETTEMKTKPTQHSVKELRSIGIQPDILLCRSDREIPLHEQRKIALFCNVRESSVIQALDCRSIYEVPLSYHEEGFDREVLSIFGIDDPPSADLSRWQDIHSRIENLEGTVKIAVVGKYTDLQDAYKSLGEALVHGGLANRVRVELQWIESEIFEEPDAVQRLEGVDGILVPGGFGERGSEGKIAAATFARTKNVPYFGICFGMQMAVIEAARNLLNIKNASTSEFGNNCTPVVGLLEEWQKGRKKIKGSDENLGGTMRLGLYDAILKNNSLISKIYSEMKIKERHRHRYEVNIKYKNDFEKKGLIFSALSPDGTLPEIIELKNHPWFIGVQFHPEFKSRPFTPHPLFSSFIKAAERRKAIN